MKIGDKVYIRAGLNVPLVNKENRSVTFYQSDNLGPGIIENIYKSYNMVAVKFDYSSVIIENKHLVPEDLYNSPLYKLMSE